MKNLSWAFTASAVLALTWGCARTTELGSQAQPETPDAGDHGPVIINPPMDGGNDPVIPILPDDAGCSFAGVKGIDGANVTAIATREDVVVAATWSGMFRSLDQGKTWETVKAFEGQKVIGVSSGLFRWVAITDDGVVSHVYASDDGRLWTPAENGLPAEINAADLFVQGYEPVLTTFAGDTSVFSFNSQAQQWTAVDVPQGTTSVATLGNTTVVLSLYGTQVQYRVGGTGAWSDATIDGPFGNFDRVWTVNAGFVLRSQNGLYLSADGKTFSAISLPPGEVSAPTEVLRPSESITAAFPTGVWRSFDGASWERVGDAPKTAAQQPRALGWDGTRLYVGTSEGVLRSEVGGSALSDASVGLQGTSIRAVNRGGLTIIAGDGRDHVYRSTDEGHTFTAGPVLQQGAEIVALARNGNTVFAGTIQSGVFRSDDDGQTFQPVNAGFPVYDNTAILRDVQSLAASGSTVIAGLSSGAARSTSDGDGWTLSTSGLPIVAYDSVGKPLYPAVIRLAVFNGAFFAVTSSGLFRSTDDGATWKDINAGLPLDANQSPPFIVAVVQGNNGIYAFGDRYDGSIYQPMVARTDDGGDSWNVIGKAIEAGTYISGAVSDGARLYAVFGSMPSEHNERLMSATDGTDWVRVSKAPSNLWPNALTVSETSLFLGTTGNGLERISLSACTF